MSKIVVALGGNALGQSLQLEQNAISLIQKVMKL